jgi:hypothetical protein
MAGFVMRVPCAVLPIGTMVRAIGHRHAGADLRVMANGNAGEMLTPDFPRLPS